MTVEEIVSTEVDDTTLPDPKLCEPDPNEDAVMYAIRQCGLWGGPIYAGPPLSSHFFSKHDRELSQQDVAIVKAIED